MGGPEVASRKAEVHHAAPRCLLTLHERANGAELGGEGIQAWVEWEIEAMRWRVPVEIDRRDLEAHDPLLAQALTEKYCIWVMRRH